MARLTWHGHSCFTLETDHGKRVMFDPFLDDNPVADVRAEQIAQLDYILCSHGHFDHFADAIALARRTNAVLVGTFELVAFAQSRGVERAHGMNVGGGHQFDIGYVKLTPALHSGTIAGDDEGRYTSWDLIAQDPSAFRDQVGSRAEVVILEPGGTYEF